MTGRSSPLAVRALFLGLVLALAGLLLALLLFPAALSDPLPGQPKDPHGLVRLGLGAAGLLVCGGTTTFVVSLVSLIVRAASSAVRSRNVRPR